MPRLSWRGRHFDNIPAIYMLTDTATGERYIGRTGKLRNRMTGHRSLPWFGGKKHDPEMVAIEVLQEWHDPKALPSDEEVKAAERHYIRTLHPELNVQHRVHLTARQQQLNAHMGWAQ